MTQMPQHPATRSDLLVTMADTVPNGEIVEVLGIARGSVVRARFFGRDFMAGLRNLVGGEVNEYTKLLAEAREQALGRLWQVVKSAKGRSAMIGKTFEVDHLPAAVCQKRQKAGLGGAGIAIEQYMLRSCRECCA